MCDGIANCNRCVRTGMTIAHFHVAFGKRLANNNDGGNAHEFGVFELHSWSHAIAIIQDDFKALCFQFRGKLFAGNGDIVAVLGSDNNMNIGR